MNRKASLLAAVTLLCLFENTRGSGYSKEFNSQYVAHVGGETSQVDICQSMQCWGLRTLVRLERASTRTAMRAPVGETIVKGDYYRKDNNQLSGLFSLSQNFSGLLHSQGLNTKE